LSQVKIDEIYVEIVGAEGELGFRQLPEIQNVDESRVDLDMEM